MIKLIISQLLISPPRNSYERSPRWNLIHWTFITYIKTRCCWYDGVRRWRHASLGSSPASSPFPAAARETVRTRPPSRPLSTEPDLQHLSLTIHPCTLLAPPSALFVHKPITFLPAVPLTTVASRLQQARKQSRLATPRMLWLFLPSLTACAEVFRDLFCRLWTEVESYLLCVNVKMWISRVAIGGTISLRILYSCFYLLGFCQYGHPRGRGFHSCGVGLMNDLT